MDHFLFIPRGEWETRVLGVYAASFKDKEDKWIVCGSEETAVCLYPQLRGQWCSSESQLPYCKLNSISVKLLGWVCENMHAESCRNRVPSEVTRFCQQYSHHSFSLTIHSQGFWFALRHPTWNNWLAVDSDLKDRFASAGLDTFYLYLLPGRL